MWKGNKLIGNNDLVKISKLSKFYGKKQVLHNINFSIPKNKVTVLLGPSGSGKSTLIRTLNGLEPFQAGAIEVFNQVIDAHTKNGWRDIRGKIGMVFQSYDLFPNMSVIKNVTLGPVKVQKRKVSEVLTAARALLKEVGLAEYENVYPRNLSGGQKQRVAIVRALILRPSLILFDEITASLDPEMVRGVLEILKKLADGKLTMVVVTHEMNFAQQIADQVVFLEEGKIVEIGDGQEFFDQPKTLRAQQFLKSMSF